MKVKIMVVDEEGVLLDSAVIETEYSTLSIVEGDVVKSVDTLKIK